MIDNIKALNRLETTKDYLKELYREQVENCPYPELKAIAKQTYEDNQMAFNIAIKAIKESNRQQSKIQALEMDNKQLETDNFNANMNCEHLQAEIERLKQNLKEAHIDIKEKQVEIEGLKYDNEVLQENFNELDQQFHYINNVEIPYLYSFTENKDKKLETLANILLGARKKAVKEFAERLKNKKARYNADYFYVIDYIPSKEIDNLVKEMVGEVWDDMEVLK